MLALVCLLGHCQATKYSSSPKQTVFALSDPQCAVCAPQSSANIGGRSSSPEQTAFALNDPQCAVCAPHLPASIGCSFRMSAPLEPLDAPHPSASFGRSYRMSAPLEPMMSRQQDASHYPAGAALKYFTCNHLGSSFLFGKGPQSCSLPSRLRCRKERTLHGTPAAPCRHQKHRHHNHHPHQPGPAPSTLPRSKRRCSKQRQAWPPTTSGEEKGTSGRNMRKHA